MLLKELVKSAEDCRLQAEDYLTYGILGAILGGRIGYMVFYAPDQLIYDPLSIIRIWEGGLSFHGGLIGVLFPFIYLVESLTSSSLMLWSITQSASL